MNGTEQSDSLIVPTKLANKAAHAAAEPMEGSGGTKRNAELQSTVRTQSRAAVSQAQGRIREAVNRNRKERLTALLHHVGTDCLRSAFVNLKKRAAPGVDEVTWDQYAENLEADLADPRTGQRRDVSSVAITPEVHTEGRWQATAARHRSNRG